MAETKRGNGWGGERDRETDDQFLGRAEQRRRGQPAQIARDKARSGEGRGRSAEKPADIPAKGWKDILLRVYRGISDDRVLANAAAVAFYALLALFPGIAALVSIYGLFADPATIEQHLDSMAGILPGGAVDVIRDQLTRLASQPRGSLGVSFVFGLLISLWSANGAIKAMFDALNVVYEEREKRSFIKLTAITLVFTIAMIGFLLLALAAFVAIPVVLNYLPGFMATLVNIARWPTMLVLVALALACIYRYGPG